MMKCKHIQKMIVNYINGSLRPDESPVFQEHIDNCQPCRHQLESMKKVLEIVGDARVEYPPENIWNSFLPDLHKRIEKEAVLTFKRNQRQKLYFLPGWAASVATVVMIIFTSVLLTYHKPPSSIEINETKITQVIENTKPKEIVYNSKPMLIANIISDILITESELEELKKLESFSQSESLYYYYEGALNDVLVELDNIKNYEGLINSLLNSELAEFDDNHIMELSISEYGSM